MNKDRRQLQARIYWRCLSWFRALKWPSANEIDFGDFLVAYDYKKGEVVVHYSDGETRLIASFSPQAKTKSVSEIEGALSCGGYELLLGKPLVLSDGAVQLSIQSQSAPLAEAEDVVGLSGDLHTALRYADLFCITPVIDGRDVYLSVNYEAEAEDLAIVSASLLVFSRFNAQSSDAVSEEPS